jgi:putative membrane protein
MRLGALLGFVAGAALAAWLLSSYGVAPILALLARAGWGLVAVVLFHLTQVAASAAAWRAVAGPTEPQPSLREFMVLRWVREGVNNLLPVAQIGGEVVAARLLRRRGVPLVCAVAGAVGDLTVEMVTQIAFTLLGLGLLLLLVGGGGVTRGVLGGVVVAVAVAVGFLAAQNLGLASLVERGLARLGAVTGWAGFGEVEGLHRAIIQLYRAPRRVLRSAWWHSVSWLLGGIEVCLALHVLGREVGIGPGLVIEALGQALKAAGFAVPGALGVQEGGLVVVCGLFGLPPELAIALSLVKRLREVALGVPALLAWQRMEALSRRAPEPMPEPTPPEPTPSGVAP